MNVVDGLLLIPLAYAGFRGFKNGFIKEVLGIAGLVIAVLLGFNLITPASTFISNQWEVSQEVVPYLAFGLVFVLTLIVVSIITVILDNVVKMVFLSIPNRLLGLAFSTLKMGIILSIALIFMSGFNIPDNEARNKSLAYPYVISVAPIAYDVIATVVPGVDNYRETVDKTLDEYNPLRNINL